jgi:hypothetical protein
MEYCPWCVRFNFDDLRSPRLTLHWQRGNIVFVSRRKDGLLLEKLDRLACNLLCCGCSLIRIVSFHTVCSANVTEDAIVQYEKDAPLCQGVFVINSDAVATLKAKHKPTAVPFLSTNDVLMAQFSVAVAPQRRAWLLKTGKMHPNTRVVTIPIFGDRRGGKDEGKKIPEDFFGNAAGLVNIILSWDLLLAGDVTAVAEVIRSQVIETARLNFVQVYSDDFLSTISRLLHLDIRPEEMHCPPRLVSEWNSTLEACKRLFQHATFGTSDNLQELIPYFSRRRPPGESWRIQYPSVFVRYQRPGLVALSVTNYPDVLDALDAVFGPREDWGVYA